MSLSKSQFACDSTPALSSFSTSYKAAQHILNSPISTNQTQGCQRHCMGRSACCQLRLIVHRDQDIKQHVFCLLDALLSTKSCRTIGCCLSNRFITQRPALLTPECAIHVYGSFSLLRMAVATKHCDSVVINRHVHGMTAGMTRTIV